METLETEKSIIRLHKPSLWPIIISIVCALVLGLSLFFNIMLAGTVGALANAEAAKDQLNKVVDDGDGDGHIVVVDIKGVISNQSEDTMFGEGQSLQQRVMKTLRQIQEDDDVQAVILNIDTPGGGVTSSDIIHHEISKLRKANVPVVTIMGDLCTSGGYYIAVASDYIIARPTSLTGSIGVILGLMNAHQLAEKIGVEATPVTSGAMKDAGSPWRPMTTDERGQFQYVVDELYTRFVDLVLEGRMGKQGLNTDTETARAQIAPLTDGRVITAQQALKGGLIDGVGHWEEAVAKARELAGSEAPVIRYNQPQTFFDLFKVEQPAPLKPLGLQNEITRFEYRWRP